MKFLALPFGPEHEGRVAVGSPRHRDWAIGKLVLNQPMLRQDSCRVGLGDLSIAYTNQAIAVADEGASLDLDLVVERPDSGFVGGEEPEQIVDFIAGMTDRFALAYVSELG